MGGAEKEPAGGSWIILRCAGRDTLRLAKSLDEDGYEVWAPAEPRTIIAHRTRLKRQIEVALLPSYVFAREGQRVDLFKLAEMDVRPRRGFSGGKPAHAGFSMMMGPNGALEITDRQLTALRQIEAKRALLKRADRSFKPGEQVRVGDGLGAGLVGSVVRSNRKNTKVDFGRLGELTFRTSILSQDDVGAGLP